MVAVLFALALIAQLVGILPPVVGLGTTARQFSVLSEDSLGDEDSSGRIFEGRDRFAHAQRLFDWVTRNGGDTSRLALAHARRVSGDVLEAEAELSVVAARQAGLSKKLKVKKRKRRQDDAVAQEEAEGRPILSLPQSLLLCASTRTMRQEHKSLGMKRGRNRIVAWVLDAVDAGVAQGRSALALRLLMERRAQLLVESDLAAQYQQGIEGGGTITSNGLDPTFWSSYVASLPLSTFIASPLSWDEPSQLAGSACASRIEADLTGLREDFASLVPFLSQKSKQGGSEPGGSSAAAAIDSLAAEPVGFDEYLWAWEMIFSRAFEVQKPNEEPESCMVPVADLLNHDNAAKTTFQVTEKFVMSVQDQYSEGEEIFNNYSPRSNCDCLRLYGFTVEKNNFDSVALDLTKVVKQIPEESIKEEILRDAGLDTPFPYSDGIFFVGAHGVSPETLALYRLMQLTRREALDRPNLFVPLRAKQERQVRAKVKQLLEDTLQKTVEAFSDRLSSLGVDASRVVQSEIALLQAAIDAS